MFHSPVFTCEKNLEVTVRIFSVLLSQISVLESYLAICFKDVKGTKKLGKERAKTRLLQQFA